MSIQLPQGFWDHEVSGIVHPAADWLWHGLIAKDNITLLTSLWKSGKTTLLSHLLGRRKEGGGLLGLAVTAGKTVVISEEPRALWEERIARLDFGGRVHFFCRPFPHVPSVEEWRGLLDRIAELHDQDGADFVVVDPLTHFVRHENSQRGMLDTLLPLRKLSEAGMGVLVLHHPRKGASETGQSSRGAGALLSHVDISIEMHKPGGDGETRSRRLLCESRYAATPRRLLFELNADATDYTVLPDAVDDDFQRQWEVLRMVLEDASKKLTRQELLDEWPADFVKPCSTTLWNWLTHAVRSKLVLSEGTGRRTDPFRYWLPDSEARWRRDNPLYDIFEKQRQDLRNLGFALPGHKKRIEAEPDASVRLWPPGAPRE